MNNVLACPYSMGFRKIPRAMNLNRRSRLSLCQFFGGLDPAMRSAHGQPVLAPYSEDGKLRLTRTGLSNLNV